MAAPGNLNLALPLTSLDLAILNCQSGLYIGPWQSQAGPRAIKVDPPSCLSWSLSHGNLSLTECSWVAFGAGCEIAKNEDIPKWSMLTESLL